MIVDSIPVQTFIVINSKEDLDRIHFNMFYSGVTSKISGLFREYLEHRKDMTFMSYPLIIVRCAKGYRGITNYKWTHGASELYRKYEYKEYDFKLFQMNAAIEALDAI